MIFDRKRQILIDSIKKLLALKVSDEEIIANLKDIGIDEKQARELIGEAKGMPAKKEWEEIGEEEERGEDSSKVLLEVAETLASKPEKAEEVPFAEEMAEEIGEEPAQEGRQRVPIARRPEAPPKPAEKPPEKKPEERKKEEKAKKKEEKFKGKKGKEAEKPAPKPEAKPATRAETQQMWEKGILTTIDQKLNEMKKLKEEIDAVISGKVTEATRAEMSKMKVLFDSQRTLLVDKVESSLENKLGEVTGIIDDKIRQMREENKGIIENIERLSVKKKEYDSSVASLENKTAELQKAKEQLASEIKSELFRSKGEMQSFLDKAEAKMQDIDASVSKTLELETQVTDGMVKSAEEKIEQLTAKKIGDLTQQVESNLAELKTIKERIQVDRIDSQLSRIDGLDKELEDLREEEKQKIVQDLSAFKGEFRRLLEKSAQDLSYFKDQFLKLISTNTEKLNQSLNEIMRQRAVAEEQITKRVSLVDKKMADLGAFEKTFSTEIDARLDKISEKEKIIDSIEKRLSALSRDVEGSLNQLRSLMQRAQHEKLDAYLKRLEGLDKELDAMHMQETQKIEQALDAYNKKFQELLGANEQDLGYFKDQFLKLIGENMDKLNKSINELKEQRNVAEEQINKRVKLIDGKIAELEAFEKSFAQEMGVALDKVAEKKGEAKTFDKRKWKK